MNQDQNHAHEIMPSLSVSPPYRDPACLAAHTNQAPIHLQAQARKGDPCSPSRTRRGISNQHSAEQAQKGGFPSMISLAFRFLQDSPLK